VFVFFQQALKQDNTDFAAFWQCCAPLSKRTRRAVKLIPWEILEQQKGIPRPSTNPNFSGNVLHSSHVFKGMLDELEEDADSKDNDDIVKPYDLDLKDTFYQFVI
jgi:hypothetical protein